MRPIPHAFRIAILSGLFALSAFGQGTTTYAVGAGAPSGSQPNFQIAFGRNAANFQNLINNAATTPGLNQVTASGAGYYQEYAASGGGGKYALVTASATAAQNPNSIYQVWGDIYPTYSSLISTAGFPGADEASCPTNSSGTCNYQVYGNDYAIFAFSSPAKAVYTLKDPYYTEWNTMGGLGTLGVMASAANSIKSVEGTAATEVDFSGGSIFSYTNATSAATVTYTVSGSIYAAFAAAGGAVLLGLPTSEETVLASGMHMQTFELVRITYTPGSAATVSFPVSSISFPTVSSTINLAQPGSTATVTAYVLDSRSQSVTDRVITWSTTNGNVVAVQGTGYTVTVKGLATGAANVYATSEGKTSSPLLVVVGGTCCNVGDGAPTLAITQAFTAAATRNSLSVQLPNPTGVVRSGAGYIQVLTAADGSGTPYVIALADGSGTAYVISGAIYAAYLTAGGFSGSLGYPASDAANGAQSFATGAVIAGSPAYVIPTAIATKWKTLSALGAPAAAAVSLRSITGAAAISQTFANGAIYVITSSGAAWASSGLILARYLAIGGAAGTMGLPTGDITTSGGVSTQTFENGTITLAAGAAAAVEHVNPRKPAITVTPATVTPGATVNISLSGFAPGASLSVAVTGQPAFTVTPQYGSFSWNVVIPRTAVAGAVTVQARDTGSSDTASASWTVSSVAALLPGLTVISGDQQTGLPGGLLPTPLVAVLHDSNGNALPGVPVAYAASPGAAVQGSSVTDANGQITAAFRLPASAGAAVVSFTAANQTVTFSALASAKTISGFPSVASVPQGSLVASMAALIQYQQSSGGLSLGVGSATVSTLDQWLTANSGYAVSDSGSQIANPWVAAAYAKTSLVVESATQNRVRDLIGQGIPSVVLLKIAGGGYAAVDAVGVASDGSLQIADAANGRSSLNDYLNGFTSSGGANVIGTIAAVFRFAVPATSATGFVAVTKLSGGAALSGMAGACTVPVDVTDSGSQPSGVRFIECDNSTAPWQLSVAKPASLIDLSLVSPKSVSVAASSAQPAWQITRSGGSLTAAPQTLAISSVVDSAAFSSVISPGGLFTIFGTGLAAGSSTTLVTVNGETASVLLSSPYQINAQIPADIRPGSASLQVTDGLGTVSQTITVAGAGPGIFVIGTSPGGNPQGAVVNQDGTVNSAANPAVRGQYISVYVTGLGATTLQGGYQQTATPVTVSIGGQTVTPSYAGLVAGFTGLYQVNVQVPAGLAPGTEIQLRLTQSGVSGNTVVVAVQ